MHVYDALRSTSLEYCYASSLSKKRPVAADVARSVCLSVGHNRQSYTKTAEPNEMPFRICTWVGPRNDVLSGGPDPLGEGAILAAFPAHREV